MGCMVRISESDAIKIINGEKSPKEVVEACAVEDKKVVSEKSGAGVFSPRDYAKKDSSNNKTVEVFLSAHEAKKLSEENNMNKDKKEIAEDNGFGGVTKETVTIADVVSCSDSRIGEFAEKILKVQILPVYTPAEVRERVMNIVTKLEKKRGEKKA